MTDVFLVIAGILLALTISVLVGSYRRLRGAQRKYEEARGVIEDIVLSFNRELKRETDRLELVAYKIEAVSSKCDVAHKRIEEIEKKAHSFEPKISEVLEDKEKVLSRLDEIDRKTHDVVASQEVLTTKITDLEGHTQQFSMVPEARVEAVIPIKREKALAPLTETELSVLEMLTEEGSKTAPDIKNSIKLSREHTARLMKKLYEEGYLDRDSTKIPFKYSVKKEMEKFLRKPERKTA